MAKFGASRSLKDASKKPPTSQAREGTRPSAEFEATAQSAPGEVFQAAQNPLPPNLGQAVRLQRTIGNRAFEQLLQRSTAQGRRAQREMPEGPKALLASALRSHSPSTTKSAAPRNTLSVSQLASSRAAAFAHLYGHPASTPGPMVQRRSSHGVSVSGMRFAPRGIPADGKTTSQATVRYAGRIAGGAKINWSIVAPAYGTTVDAKGLITPGAAIKKGAAKVRVKVKAEDSKWPGANTFGYLTLWDADYLQAKIDYPKFVAQTKKMDPYTPGRFGKFAIEYRPRSHVLYATVRVGFNFIDDLPGAAKWRRASKARFQRKFVRAVQRRWSAQYQFVNVREPQSIWKKLNPVRVLVRVKQKGKGAPHQVIDVHKKNVGAAVGVGGVRGKVRLAAADATPPVGNFPLTGPGELASLAGVTPTPILFAAGKSDIGAADKKKLEFMATYLRRIKDPRFKVTITGHHEHVVPAPKATAAQKAAATRQARRLSRERAREVYRILRAGRATYHRIVTRGVGDTGAAATPAWNKVDIASALPAGWKNVQTTLAHEAGHMFGIGDEYVTAGAKVGDLTTHYDLTKRAFGQQYADVAAKKVAEGGSLMHSGRDLRPLHYVTFWDGLSQLTQALAVPKVPFAQKDWKFRGEG